MHHGYRRLTLVDNGRPWPHAEVFRAELEPLEPVRDAWLSWIEPGGFIVPHRDGSPYFERWQVPLSTAGHWGDGTEAEDGVPFQVRHWESHAVVNDSDRPRIHLVVDRDVPVDAPSQKFQTYPPTPEIEALIERSRDAASQG